MSRPFCDPRELLNSSKETKNQFHLQLYEKQYQRTSLQGIASQKKMKYGSFDPKYKIMFIFSLNFFFRVNQLVKRTTTVNE